MFGFLKTIINVEIKDVEAKLMPTPECVYGGIGEVEMEVFSAGNAKIECEIKHSGIPDGTQVDVVVGGNTIATLMMQGGRAKARLAFAEGDSIPQADIGDTAEMEINGQVCYRGTFCRD